MNILETINLIHTFPNGTKALDNINLSFDAGEFVIIAGANGSGKTVFTRHLNGLLSPTAGEVLLEGKPISQDLTAVRKRIGLIFQNSDSQIVGQTVAEDVAFGPENLRLSREEVDIRVKTSLEAMGLSPYAGLSPRVLSGGQKKKLSIAGILAMKPKIIIFDEPFTGLDYPGVNQVLKAILLLHQNGHTIILVTHELEKVLAHADRLIIMENGQVVQDGEPALLLEQVEKYGIHKPYGENREIRTMTWLK